MGIWTENPKQCLLPKTISSKEISISRMIFLCTIVVSPGILDGITLAYSGIALPQMNLDVDGASWFGSLQVLGSIFSSIVGGLMLDKVGRRPTVLLAVLPTCIGWLLISMGTSNIIIFTGRILTGFTSGILYFGQVYAAECIVVNHTHLRNHFNTWGMISMSLGELLCYTLAYLLPYREVAFVSASIAAIICLAIFCYIPESPHWLYKRGRLAAARNSERKLSIYQPILNNDYIPPTSELKTNMKKIIEGLSRKDVYKPLCIMTIWLSLIMFSGGQCIISYMVDVLTIQTNIRSSYWKLPPLNITRQKSLVQISEYQVSSSSNSPITSAYMLTVISGICNLVAVILMSSVITRTRTKLTFLTSTFCMSVALLAYGVSEFRIWQPTFAIVHVVSVWLILFFYAFGTASVATSVVGEMFPHDAKGFASIPMISMSLTGAIAVKLHLYLYSYFGGWLYFIYAFINFINMIFTAVFVPETVGKTADEIRNEFLR